MLMPNPISSKSRSRTGPAKNTDPLGSVILHVDYTVPVERSRRKLERSSTKASRGTKVAVLQVNDAPQSMVERALRVSAHNASPPGSAVRGAGKADRFSPGRYPYALPRQRVELAVARYAEGTPPPNKRW